MSATIRFSAPRAFSLIEVLIGVLVLALGLLGLGAIIPVVIREQRAAVSSTLGSEAAKAAKRYLLMRPDLDPATGFYFNNATPQVAQPTIGWDVWLMDATWSPEVVPPQTPQANAYLWEPWRTGGTKQNIILTAGSTPPWGSAGSIPGDFGWFFQRPGTLPPLYTTITLADRLWPNESMQGEASLLPGVDPHRPQFVWDFIGRRVQTAPGEPRQLQVAIFVRPLDLNIRIPRGVHQTRPPTPITLRDVVLNRGLAATSDARVPVCSYPKSAGTQQFLPTNAGVLGSGVPSYSEPVFVDAQFDPAQPDRIQFPALGFNDNAWKLLSTTGQKLLDNLGNVYTVLGIPDELEPGATSSTLEVIVDPPVPSYIPSSLTAGPNTLGALRQIVFTPQIPAAVEVFTITRTVP